MNKSCNRCNKFKPASQFTRSKDKKDGIYPTCKECVKSRRAEINNHKLNGIYDLGDGSKLCDWCESSIGGRKNRKYCNESCAQKAKRVRSYGLTVEEYRQLLKDQNGICSICQRETNNWNIDHNHDSLETYGIICGTCNSQLLAWTFHDVEIVKRLLRYLESPPVREKLGRRYVTDWISNKHKSSSVNGPWIWRKNASKG